ncbi:hypothetical protein H0H87_011451 [Tephrocybe sp. NHM501043]|nr:hypothetical protein H0H87_011451 [Tephrocybe sp. NHM501043]
MPQTSSFSMLDQLKDSIGLKNNPHATQKDNAILPLLDLDGLENLVTAIDNPMDKDASSSNMPVTKKPNLVLRSPLFGPSSLGNDTCAIQAVFGPASLKNNPSATQKEDAIFPPLNPESNLVLRSPFFGPSSLKNNTHAIQAVCGPASLKNNPSTTQKEDGIFPPLDPDGLENLVTATNDPMDEDALSSNTMVTEKSNLVLMSALFGPISLKNDTCEICREGATCPPLTLDGLKNPVTTADAPMDEDPSSSNMTVSETSKESPP